MASAASGEEISLCTQKPDLLQDIPELKADRAELESACLNCGGTGSTRLLVTCIPYFKEVVVMSFTCNICAWQNNELQPAAKIQDKGVRYTLTLTSPRDLNRQVVKTKWASLSLPELEFEIPAGTQEGSISTIEGIIDRAVTGLKMRIDVMKFEEPEVARKLQEFVTSLEEVKSFKSEFTMILDDPSGNSFLENLLAPQVDPKMEVSMYDRTREQDETLGLTLQEEVSEQAEASVNNVSEQLKDEVLNFPTNCPACNAPCETNMKVTNIPNFKEVIIMATNCESCGHRTNEVKSGASIEPMGTKLILVMGKPEDLHRDVLKSDTCSMSIPELELEVGAGAFGGRFTTVEGLIENVKYQLKEENPFITGDSADPEMKSKLKKFFEQLNEIIAGTRPATIILDDPCGNSYIQKLEDETRLKTEKYERSFQQNDELGLNDMKTENYES